MVKELMIVVAVLIVAWSAVGQQGERNNVKIASARFARWDAGCPRIMGPKAFGATPGRVFSYSFPTCGDRNGLRFSISHGSLPPGAVLDVVTGGLTGRVVKAGNYSFKVRAQNVLGACVKEFLLVIGDGALSLTPPMGWTSWNAFTQDVDRRRIESSACAIVEKGLAARGYSYVNIDSCWQGNRDEKSKALQPNEKFPDMGGLVRKIHDMGLKAGIYSTPMVIAWGSDESRVFLGGTGYPLDPEYFHDYYGGCGKVGYEEMDATQFAEWGFDWLKYDWPTTDVVHAKRMRRALDATGRDIVLQLCTLCRVKDAAAYAESASLVRESPDTKDDWHYLLTGDTENKRELFKAADAWLALIRPGFWYDLDMFSLGVMRCWRTEHLAQRGAPPPSSFANHLTRDEQESHFAWWAIIPAPLFLSCDLDNLDDFTLNLVTNEELIEINQDYPAVPATFVDLENGTCRIWKRLLSDGRRVIAFFNLGEAVWMVNHPLEHRCLVRNVLTRTDLGECDVISISLRAHACSVFVLTDRSSPQ